MRKKHLILVSYHLIQFMNVNVMKSHEFLLFWLTALAPCGGPVASTPTRSFSALNNTRFQLHRNLKQRISERKVALIYRLFGILVKSGHIFILIYMKDSVGILRKGSDVYLDGSTRKRTYNKRYRKEILMRIKINV